MDKAKSILLSVFFLVSTFRKENNDNSLANLKPNNLTKIVKTNPINSLDTKDPSSKLEPLKSTGMYKSANSNILDKSTPHRTAERQTLHNSKIPLVI